MSTSDQHLLEVEPLISYPHEAQVGKSYLMTIDLRLVTLPETWPYDDEEYPVWCHLDTMPLFSHKPLSEGERAVVLHRFGGTYGPAKFLLTAAREAMRGKIHITLMNKWGSPIDYIPIEAEIKHDNVPGPMSEAKPIGAQSQLQQAVPVVTREELLELLQSGNQDFSNRNLEGIDLGGTDLSGIDLSGAKLSNSNLTNADLSNANLSNADLKGARLGGADLSGANLRGADLGGTELYERELSGTELYEAALSGAMTSELGLDNPKSLKNAIMPDGSKHP